MLSTVTCHRCQQPVKVRSGATEIKCPNCASVITFRQKNSVPVATWKQSTGGPGINLWIKLGLLSAGISVVALLWYLFGFGSRKDPSKKTEQTELHSAGQRVTVKLKYDGEIQGEVLGEDQMQILICTDSCALTLAKTDIANIEDGGVPDHQSASAENQRLPAFDRAIVAFQRSCARYFRPIPATMIDFEPFKDVPYMSFRGGGFELNVYGDPYSPACVEIGIVREAEKPESLRNYPKTVIAHERRYQIKAHAS